MSCLSPYTISAFPGVPNSGGGLGTMLSVSLHMNLPHSLTESQNVSYVREWALASGSLSLSPQTSRNG